MWKLHESITSSLSSIGVDLAGILGGRMASAEGGSVPSGVRYGRGVRPTRGPGGESWASPAGSGAEQLPKTDIFFSILKATERSFLYLYDKNLRGGNLHIASPYSKFWGTPSPVIYAHDRKSHELLCKTREYNVEW